MPTTEALHLRFGATEIAGRIAASLHEALGIDLDNLEAAMDSGDADKAGDTLHRMAGGTGAVGTLVIAHHLRDLSTAVVRDGLTGQRTALEKVQQVMTVYRNVVGSLL
jgi:hypothetical protein